MFVLNIETGNAEMILPIQIATALRETAARMEETADTAGVILDGNGNCVGSFGFEMRDDLAGAAV